jgi:hypothetical protein
MRNARMRRKPAAARARSARSRMARSGIAGDQNPAACIASQAAAAPARNFQQVAKKMANREELNVLSRLIDGALQHAVELNETMAAYILSIASREVSERIEQTEARLPTEPD